MNSVILISEQQNMPLQMIISILDYLVMLALELSLMVLDSWQTALISDLKYRRRAKTETRSPQSIFNNWRVFSRG